MKKCEFVPPTLGYLPCKRTLGHEGPCAHEISILSKKVVIFVKEQADAQPWQVDRYTIESDFPNMVITAQNADDGINFIKGALLSAIGEMTTTIPNRVIIDFEVKKDG